jgi:hypothetical protein
MAEPAAASRIRDKREVVFTAAGFGGSTLRKIRGCAEMCSWRRAQGRWALNDAGRMQNDEGIFGTTIIRHFSFVVRHWSRSV